jgi:DNA replication protein DnaC
VIHEETIQKLLDLKLHAMAAAARELTTSPPEQQLTLQEIFGMIVDREYIYRDNRRLARRLKEARLPANAASVEEVICEPARGLDKALVRSLSTCQWVRAKQNVIVVGATGTGKTFLGTALAQAACRAGFRALVTRTPRLLHELGIARGDGSYASVLQKIGRAEVLVLDSCGVPAYVESGSRFCVVLDLAVAALHITRLRRLTSVPFVAPTMEVANACRDLSAGPRPVHVAALAGASS